MTLLADRYVQGGAVHVLIVGLEVYEGDMTPLPGVLATTKRLATWWMGTHVDQRLLGGGRVATVDVLASADHPVQMLHDSGALVTIAEAKSTAVRQAIRDWCQRSRGSHMAVIHWIGHGETQGQSSSQRLHALYCQDLMGCGQYQEAIDWDDTLNAVRSNLFENASLEALPPAETKLLCFIDACRCWSPQSERFGYERVFTKYGRVPRDDRTLVFYGAEAGGEAYCIRPNIPVGDDFADGGAIFSEAIRLALDRFGARLRSTKDGPAAYFDSIRDAAQLRLERWSGRVLALKGLRPTVQCDPGGWPLRRTFARIPAPMSMVDIVLSDISLMPHAECEVEGPLGPVPTCKMSKCWELDISREPHQVRISFKRPMALGTVTTGPFRPESEYLRCDVDCNGSVQ